MSKWSNLSKDVGWDRGGSIQSFPSLEEVATLNDFDVLWYNRYLRSPKNDDEVEVLNHIVFKLGEVRSRLERE